MEFPAKMATVLGRECLVTSRDCGVATSSFLGIVSPSARSMCLPSLYFPRARSGKRYGKELLESEDSCSSSPSCMGSTGDASTLFLSSSRIRSSMSEMPLRWTSPHTKGLNHSGMLRLLITAQYTSKLAQGGKFRRVRNVALASFGIKSKRSRNGEKIDMTKSLSKMLPLVVAMTAVAALLRPASFAWMSKEYYAPTLGGIMLSIGIQLSVSDFALAFKRPVPVIIGYAAQYIMKPLLGFMIVNVFRVPSTFGAGLVLTSCVAGAQLSSYATFLSEGDVALSIVLTSLTTITSVAVTPLLSRILIGSVIPVNLVAMAKSILQVVIVPVFLGLALNTYAKSAVDRVRTFMPLVAMICTSLCIGSPLALNRDMIVSRQGFQLLLPVVVFHTGAFTFGYWISQCTAWRQETKVARTISLCSGMQSSTLAMLLASQFLGMSHAVPPACSVVVMALMGLTLGSFWGKGLTVTGVLPNVGQSNGSAAEAF